VSAPDTMAEPSGAHRGLRGIVPPGGISPFKVASLLLQYPTVALFDGLGQLAAEVAAGPRATRRPFRQLIDWLDRTDPDTVARHYVETFDLRRRCAPYLTYYRYGDTRKRGMAMVEFKTAYRVAGLVPVEDELPDYLPMVLDFAAAHPRGERLLRRHRADLEVLLRSLRDARSPYADVVEGVCAVLPGLRRPDQALVRRLLESGPPDEQVGLLDAGTAPFAPPEYLRPAATDECGSEPAIGGTVPHSSGTEAAR
jgi:nitrate reductase molybdenum cofactor assembly chaperone NarJ/NarW